jgi:hypothetical protein
LNVNKLNKGMNAYFEVIHCSILLPFSVDTLGIHTLKGTVCLTSELRILTCDALQKCGCHGLQPYDQIHFPKSQPIVLKAVSE